MPQSGIYVNRFRQVSEDVRECVQQVVRKTAQDIAATAKSLAPVKTGSLRDGIYVATNEYTDYYAAAAAARADNPGVDILDPLTVSSPTEAGVGMAVGHWQFVEFGTRFMPAQPFLTPAVNAHQQQFNEDLSRAMSGECPGHNDLDSNEGTGEAAEGGELTEAVEVVAIL